VGSLSTQHGASSGCGWRNGLQLWRVAENILYKQSRIDNKGWSSSLGVERRVNNPSPLKNKKRNAYRLLVGKPEGKRPLGRTRRRWVDNIRMDLGEVGWDGLDWFG
jgi:hypothetical protein